MARIVISLLLPFFFRNLNIFIPLYLLAGLTDVLDGYIARRYNATSVTGARLDSVADIFFYIVLVLYLLLVYPDILLTYLVPLFIALVLRFLNILIGIIKFHKITMVHTIGNKLTGLLLFFVPVFLWLNINSGLFVIILLVILATLEESLILLSSNKDKIDLNRKSFFNPRKPPR